MQRKTLKRGSKEKLAHLAPYEMQNVVCEITAECGGCDGDCVNCEGGK